MEKPQTRFYIIEASMLPEIFIKVSRAKELLETGACITVAQAVSSVGISRSAFYKYKDCITPFKDMKRDQVLTLSVLMRDEPGALSRVLSIFASSNTNILTINQSIPSNGVAMVTISCTAADMLSFDALRARIEAAENVIKIDLLAG